MKFECPSCFLLWADSRSPKDEYHQILCSFCAKRHTEIELLNWQIDHIENISSEKHPRVIRNLFRYVTQEMSILKEKVYEHGLSTEKTKEEDTQ